MAHTNSDIHPGCVKKANDKDTVTHLRFLCRCSDLKAHHVVHRHSEKSRDPDQSRDCVLNRNRDQGSDVELVVPPCMYTNLTAHLICRETNKIDTFLSLLNPRPTGPLDFLPPDEGGWRH